MARQVSNQYGAYAMQHNQAPRMMFFDDDSSDSEEQRRLQNAPDTPIVLTLAANASEQPVRHQAAEWFPPSRRMPTTEDEETVPRPPPVEFPSHTPIGAPGGLGVSRIESRPAITSALTALLSAQASTDSIENNPVSEQTYNPFALFGATSQRREERPGNSSERMLADTIGRLQERIQSLLQHMDPSDPQYGPLMETYTRAGDLFNNTVGYARMVDGRQRAEQDLAALPTTAIAEEEVPAFHLPRPYLSFRTSRHDEEDVRWRGDSLYAKWLSKGSTPKQHPVHGAISTHLGRPVEPVPSRQLPPPWLNGPASRLMPSRRLGAPRIAGATPFTREAGSSMAASAAAMAQTRLGAFMANNTRDDMQNNSGDMEYQSRLDRFLTMRRLQSMARNGQPRSSNVLNAPLRAPFQAPIIRPSVPTLRMSDVMPPRGYTALDHNVHREEEDTSLQADLELPGGMRTPPSVNQRYLAEETEREEPGEVPNSIIRGGAAFFTQW